MKKDYFADFKNILLKLEAGDSKGGNIALDKAIISIVKLIMQQAGKGNKIFFIGNGGSASIASHMATDFLKNAEIPALVFTDSSLITCLSNDLGYEYIFQKPIELFSQKGDILFAISSSGMSENILNAVNKARRKGCFIITLSGFNRNNRLRKLGDINFYLPSCCYGHVEIGHLIICHSIADKIMELKRNG